MSEAITTQLANLDARVNALESQSKKIDLIHLTVARIETKIEDMHTPETCPKGWQVKDHEVRIRSLETTTGEAKGQERGQEKTGTAVWIRLSAAIGWTIAIAALLINLFKH